MSGKAVAILSQLVDDLQTKKAKQRTEAFGKALWQSGNMTPENVRALAGQYGLDITNDIDRTAIANGLTLAQQAFDYQNAKTDASRATTNFQNQQTLFKNEMIDRAEVEKRKAGLNAGFKTLLGGGTFEDSAKNLASSDDASTLLNFSKALQDRKTAVQEKSLDIQERNADIDRIKAQTESYQLDKKYTQMRIDAQKGDEDAARAVATARANANTAMTSMRSILYGEDGNNYGKLIMTKDENGDPVFSGQVANSKKAAIEQAALRNGWVLDMEPIDQEITINDGGYFGLAKKDSLWEVVSAYPVVVTKPEESLDNTLMPAHSRTVIPKSNDKSGSSELDDIFSAAEKRAATTQPAQTKQPEQEEKKYGAYSVDSNGTIYRWTGNRKQVVMRKPPETKKNVYMHGKPSEIVQNPEYNRYVELLKKVNNAGALANMLGAGQ